MDVHALGCVSLVDKLHRLLGARADEEKGVELPAGPLDVPNMLRRDPGVYVDYTHWREGVPVWSCLLKPRNLIISLYLNLESGILNLECPYNIPCNRGTDCLWTGKGVDSDHTSHELASGAMSTLHGYRVH
jgi:hypothetical protein